MGVVVMVASSKFTFNYVAITGKRLSDLCFIKEKRNVSNKQRLFFIAASCICRRVRGKGQIQKISAWRLDASGMIILNKERDENPFVVS